jgi:predicted Zn-ribbon and HTH transcriptional regulator
MSSPKNCPECNAEMEIGFVPDASFMGAWQTCWHRGPAEKASSVFDQLKSGAGIKYDRKEMVPITACRCTQCGLLKFYAVEKSD